MVYQPPYHGFFHRDCDHIRILHCCRYTGGVAAINYLEEHYGDSGIVTGAYLLGGGAALIGLWNIPYVPVAGVVLGCVGALVMFVQSFRIVFTLSDDISTGFLRALIYLVVSAAGAVLVYYFPSVFGYIFDYIAN